MECRKCGKGSIIEKGVVFSTFEKFPKDFSLKTECYIKDMYHSSQPCTFSEGFMAVYHKGL